MPRSALCLLLLIPALSACGKTDDRLKAVEDRLAKVEQTLGAHKAITLKPGQTGYSILETDMGRIPVAIARIEPNGTGSRVVLDFGNPSAARLTGMKARIEYGANDGNAANTTNTANDGKTAPLMGSTQSVDFAAPEPLPPGSWRQYSIDLPVAPTQIGWLRISNFDGGTVDLLSQ